MSEIEKAAELVRELATTDAMFANFMADTSFDSAEEMQRFIEWFNQPGRIPSGWDVTRYARAQMALAYAELTAKLAEAEAECESRRAQHAELNAELLDLARRYDPNCDIYVYEDQANAMDAARQTVEAMQELAEFLGRDPEGCLADCPDEAMGRIENAERRLAYFDDATPLTGEWCEANGAKHKDGYGWIFKGPKQLELIVTLERVYVHFGYSSILVMTNPTLGAFRRLATGLGIQLKEDA